MKERLYLIDLYDIYSSLLTDKQQKYFEDYYFNNLSLSEISENEDITRNAIHKHIKDACEKLNYYEEKLKINEKNKKILKISKKLNKELQKEIEEII
jgi:uncharacterized protein